jgi:hypothetical protein
MPRSSVFIFSRDHILPGSWNASDAVLAKSANRCVASFRDVLVPQCSQIASIVGWTVTTVEPHPLEAGDWIAIGGTSSPYDGTWQISSVPSIINPGTTSEIDPTTFVLVENGMHAPASVGAGGGVGLLYSRLKERAPEFWHKNNMLARGVVGAGMRRQRKKIKMTLDFATTTWDQASRLTTYERDRLLGVDQSPYVAPPRVKLRTSLFARDIYGNLAAAIRPGDRVTVDDKANYQYAGEYEVLDPLTVIPPTCKAAGSGSTISRTPSEDSGEIELSLGPYNEAVMYDTSDPSQAGWPDVPGSDPGNSSNFTGIPLAAGKFAFFTGQLASGSAFQLPSTGFPAANVLCWASPAGYLSNVGQVETILLCDASTALVVTLQYLGEGNVWGGQTNYACLTWLSADVPSVLGALTWLALTLLGGEEICFGQGVVAGDGSFTIALPSGFTTDKMFAVAFVHDWNNQSTTNHAHWFGAFVDSSNAVWGNLKDGESNVWHCNVKVLVFAWKNNMGSVTTETNATGKWMQCTLTDGEIFGVGCALGVADGTTLIVPSSAGDGATLQPMVGTSGWNYPNNGHPAHGVNTCYLDAEDVVHITFGDGEGNVWSGAADIFALFCTPATAAPTAVNVQPLSASVAAGATQQFTATVLHNANPNVTWSVDGIPGGNVTVGTIDATGNYSAPTTSGSHTITATSVGDPATSGSAAVLVTGAALPIGPPVLTDDFGNIIYVNGKAIYVE